MKNINTHDSTYALEDLTLCNLLQMYFKEKINIERIEILRVTRYCSKTLHILHVLPDLMLITFL